MLQDREEADYVAFVEFDYNVICEELNQTEKFINIFEEFLHEELMEE
ncbi:MAG: hypothetical protein ACLFMO_08320 [Eubacteriales bacterium]